MPVYLATVHAYGSWQEDHPKGFVQHGEGLKDPSPGLAAWRDAGLVLRHAEASEHAPQLIALLEKDG